MPCSQQARPRYGACWAARASPPARPRSWLPTLSAVCWRPLLRLGVPPQPAPLAPAPPSRSPLCLTTPASPHQRPRTCRPSAGSRSPRWVFAAARRSIRRRQLPPHAAAALLGHHVHSVAAPPRRLLRSVTASHPAAVPCLTPCPDPSSSLPQAKAPTQTFYYPYMAAPIPISLTEEDISIDMHIMQASAAAGQGLLARD